MIGVAFVDCETTGLDPDHHEIWEVGLITPDGKEHVWQLPVNLGAADRRALEVGRYWDRRSALTSTTNLRDFSAEFSRLTWDCVLAGAVVSFDEERLRRLLRLNGACPGWHYHLCDVENLAVGFLSARNCGAPSLYWTAISEILVPPWDSEKLSRALAVDPERFDRHTALGDARWAKAIYERVMEAL